MKTNKYAELFPYRRTISPLFRMCCLSHMVEWLLHGTPSFQHYLKRKDSCRQACILLILPLYSSFFSTLLSLKQWSSISGHQPPSPQSKKTLPYPNFKGFRHPPCLPWQHDFLNTHQTTLAENIFLIHPGGNIWRWCRPIWRGNKMVYFLWTVVCGVNPHGYSPVYVLSGLMEAKRKHRGRSKEICMMEHYSYSMKTTREPT